MTQYLLDTNICIFLMRGKYNIYEKMKEVGVRNCHISEITYAELLFVIERSDRKEINMKMLSDFIQCVDIISISSVLPKFAKEKNNLWNIGKPVDDFDLLIGVTSVAKHYIMVTDNIKHFQNIQDIQLENWIQR